MKLYFHRTKTLSCGKFFSLFYPKNTAKIDNNSLLLRDIILFIFEIYSHFISTYSSSSSPRTLSSTCRYDFLVGVTRAEAYFAFNSEDVQYGIEAERRSKILKTYVRNTYSYHLNEILATIVNEYTDWERPVQHPINIRYD